MDTTLFLILFIVLGFWTVLNFFSSALKERDIEVTAFTLLWRTQRFTEVINAISEKFGRFWDYFGKIGIITSVAGSGAAIFLLAKQILKIIEKPETHGGVTLAIPGLTIPLWYGLIGIVTLVVVHECAHGVIARREDVPLKSVGAGIFIALPLAFVEPEEEEIQKTSPWTRMKVYGAGSTANFALGIIAFLLLTACNPLIIQNGIEIQEVQEGMPAEGILNEGMIIYSVNGEKFQTQSEFSAIMDKFGPGDTITLDTNKGSKEITLTENPEDPTKGYIGIYLKTHLTTKYGGFLLPIYFSLYWIFVLNIGIGLVNLLPIAPFLDGGKIVKELIELKIPKPVSTGLSVILTLFSVSLLVLNFFPELLKMVV